MELVETEKIGRWTGIKIKLQNASFLAVVAEKGYVMCGYLNIETAERLGDAACMVSGVKDFKGVLEAKIVKSTSKAKALGVMDGMPCEEALRLLS